MPSLKQLVARAVLLLRTQPTLWTPPLGIALLSSLLVPSGTGPVALMLLISGLISLAVTAGWYALIARADKDVRPVWDDFFVAIGRHFLGLILGTVVFGILVAVVALPLIYLGATWAGPDNLVKLQTQLPKILEQVSAHPETLATVDPGLLLALNRLAIALTGAAAWYGVVTIALLFWKQALVLGHHSWWVSYRESLAVLRENFGTVMGFLSLQAIAYLVAMVLGFLPFPIGLVGWFGVIAVHVWGTVALTVLYVRARPPVHSTEETKRDPQAV